MKNIYLILFICVCISSVGISQTNITAVKVGDRIDVTINKFFFTSYLFAKNEKYPFFYSVNGPSGACVTYMRNGIWLHHSSQFFGSNDVNGGNYWNKALKVGQCR